MAFNIYKQGQGKYTRLWSGFAFATVAGLGCLRLYTYLQAADWDMGRKAGMWIATMVPVGIFVISGIAIFWLVNKPSVADFMISAEGEMKKVSWSSKKEIVVSTTVVIAVVILMALFLGVIDIIFSRVFMKFFGL